MSYRLDQLHRLLWLVVLFFLTITQTSRAKDADALLVGLNVPLSGPYALQGIDQLRAYTLAIEQVNARGGLLGRRVVYEVRDTRTDADVAARNAQELIDQGAMMVTGGSSSAEAISQAKVCQENKILFLAGLSHSNETTGVEGQRYAFRWFHNAHQSAKALMPVMRDRFGMHATYAFIYADYTWGRTVVDSLAGEIVKTGGRVLLRLPTSLGATNFFHELMRAQRAGPEVLVLVHFGDDLIHSLRQAGMLQIRQEMNLVAPLMEINMALALGPEFMQGILTTKSWYHGLADTYPGSREFVELFEARYHKKPGNAAAAAWVNLFQYADAVRRTQSLSSARLVKALEGHHFTQLTKDEYWRDWDHQGIHTTYVLLGKTLADSRNEWDLFHIVDEQEGDALARTRSENPIQLQPLD